MKNFSSITSLFLNKKVYGPGVDKQLMTLRGLYFWLYSAAGVNMPFLPLYFSEQGYSSSQIAMFMMAGSLLAIFFQPVWGYINDLTQDGKKIIMVLWSLTILCSIGLFVSASYQVTFLFVVLMVFFFQPAFILVRQPHFLSFVVSIKKRINKT